MKKPNIKIIPTKALVLFLTVITSLNSLTAGPLHIAAAEGDTEKVRNLLKELKKPKSGRWNAFLEPDIKSEVNRKNDKGETPLHIAAYHAHYEIVEMLIEAEVNLEIKDYYGRTALFIALSSNARQFDLASRKWDARRETVRLLLSGGADPNISVFYGDDYDRDDNNKTPLHLVATTRSNFRGGRPEFIQMLVDHGADTEAKTQNGSTPLFLAVTKNSRTIETIEALLTANSNANANNHGAGRYWTTVLHRAVEAGSARVVEMLVTAGAEVNSLNGQGETPLYEAARDGHFKIASYLLQHGALPNLVGEGAHRTPLQAALFKGHSKIVKLLNKAGAHHDLFTATMMGDIALIENFLRVGQSANSTLVGGDTPLHYAAAGGKWEAAEVLLRAGADINAPDEKSLTPIFFAAINGKCEMIKRLANAGANVFHVDNEGQTILERAGILQLYLPNFDEVKTLLESLMSPPTASCEDSDPAPAENTTTAQDDEVAKLRKQVEEMKTLLMQQQKASTTTQSPPPPSTTSARVEQQKSKNATIPRPGNTSTTPQQKGSVSGWTKIHEAAMQGQIEKLEELSWGCDFDVSDQNGRTPLHAAVKGNQVATATFLLENEVNIDAQTTGGWTPLYIAAMQGNLALVKLLCDAGANKMLGTTRGETPLKVARKKGHLSVSSFLAGKLSRQQSPSTTTTHTARTTTKTSTSTPREPSSTSSTTHRRTPPPTSSSPSTRTTQQQKSQHAPGRKLQKQDRTTASTLEPSIDSSSDDLTPLHEAALKGDLQEIHLQSWRFSINVTDGRGRTPLHLVVMKNDVATVKYLIDKKNADVNAVTAQGQTPLDIAVERGHLTLVGLLQEKGASMSIETESGETACDLARENQSGNILASSIETINRTVQKEREDCTKLEIYLNDISPAFDRSDEQLSNLDFQALIDFRGCSSSEETILHLALAPVVMQVLIEKGANVNAPNNFDQGTPLHEAAKNGRLEAVKLLCENGARLDVKTTSHWSNYATPLELARKNKHREVAKYLSNFAAQQ